MSWSGSFRNAAFAGPGIYQAENGVRCFIDMSTTPGAVTVNAPPVAEDHQSFIVEWDNPTRADLTVQAPGNFEDPTAEIYATVPSLTLAFQRGTIGFTLLGGQWEVFTWSLFGVNLATNFAIAWEGRATNGLCTLTGSYQGVEVERTALGFYTVRLETGTLNTPSMISPAPQATGLPAETSPELRLEDIGMVTSDEILVNSGTRNKNGQFNDDDLIQDPANFMALVGQLFP